ncbi:hypothetical protein K492DRAFT_174099 [Lichtheimia hyalospora FSU 10163]|nr:hypothetical protein K492DRAFT_174099 [Lichtheimia hyalospora FSU 10163]
MDLEERAKLNLTVLKRHDPSISDICDQSPHAVVYKFSRDKNSWDKMGMEGVLFLVHRETSPKYALCILNRISMDNFWLYLSDIVDISLNEEFVMCQTSEGKACGLWLFEEKDRQRFVDRILQLRKQEQDQVDILKFFGRATITPQSPANEPKPENQQQQHASELLKLLQPNKTTDDQGVKQQQQQMPQPPQPPMNHSNNHYTQPPPPMMFGGHPPPPPPPPSQPYHHPHHPYPMEDMAAAAAHVNEYPMMYPQHQSSPMRPPPPPTHPPPPPTSSTFDGDLNKSLFPGSSLHPTAAASPQKTASLLQALQGGGTNGPVPVSSTSSPRNSPYLLGNRPWPTPAAGGNYSSPLSNAPPLTSQQVMDLTQSELDHRTPEGQPTLSKPEFIQQFLNMVKNDASFLDSLYDRYKSDRPSTNKSKQIPLRYPQ